MCCKVPSIVASLTLEGQTSDISQGIFTPEVEGLYRLSLYVDMNGDGTGQGSGIVHVTYTDDANSVTITVPNLSGVSPNVIKSICIPLELEEGQTISIDTEMDATINFNLRVVVEQLDC